MNIAQSRRALFRARFVMMTLAVILAGCAAQGDNLLPPAPTGEYHLGPGDQVRVITYDDAQLTNTFTVGDDGKIAFPLLGSINAAGLTASDLATEISRSLETGKLISQPSVSVEIVAYRPVSVLGEVNKPGQYPYQPGMTTLDAVALAGGFTYRAVTSSMQDWRDVEGQTKKGSILPGATLEPGDVIIISERYF